MKICSACFSDRELKAFIESLNNSGTCDTCSLSSSSIISIDELQDFFQELIDNYKIDESGESIKNKIQGNWSLFSSHTVAADVLNFILPRLKTAIVNSDVGVNYIDEIIENYSYWAELKEELKWEKRFLTDIVHLTEDLGWDSFFNAQYQLTSGIHFYRARVHHQSNMPAYNADKMGCPKREIVNGGRSNPSGIPVLYLSDNEETIIYEVRASYLDELSIGRFKLKDEYSSIKIVDFTEDMSIFQPDRVNETIKSKLLREKISRDLSKPMRRYDSEIEYTPTQFICEFIKVFTGADGIRFQSSLHPSGKNLVVFEEDLMECIDVSLVKVNNVSLRSLKL
jgi:hypothetical protein